MSLAAIPGAGRDRPRRIGMLTPSSNTVVEPYTNWLVAAGGHDVTVHFSRLRVERIALDERSNAQFDHERMLEAADLLADARVDVIAWNGTSASWLGLHHDTALCEALRKRTGIAATTTSLGLMRVLDEQKLRRIALLTPYTTDVQQRIIENYANAGIDVVAEHHAGLSENHAFASLTESEIETACRRLASSRPEAIVLLCTNMRGALSAPGIERELGIRILDSVTTTFMDCMDIVGLASHSGSNAAKIAG